MSRLLSYLYPVTKTVPSAFSGLLEITWHNGKKHLNTQNANYSYGSLQKVLKFGLSHMDLADLGSVLLLGLGGGSVIATLRHDFGYHGLVTAVDIDPKIIDIAKHEFNLKDDAHLEIICQDAGAFMDANTAQFDLIIIDLFIDTEVPEAFMAIPFWETVVKAMAPQGSMLFNATLKKTESPAQEAVLAYLKSQVGHVAVHENVNATNTLIVAKQR